ncbi:hypothetical protein SAMN05518863_103161 [Candidatus Pantoea symbiotica]|uniref:DUF4760 domain-containing protein n=1 Tax=Candidatus Pantoea symbiotica TaxID=1884370 RepID=A0A1I3UUP5_9GAMM|nr:MULTISPECIES: hypothetical protein [Pantoea]SFJ86918.1 hypothetical protein SAMN05518863_103161 [Pantoea symbiotica]SFU61264.1 hypothetical protein SAMN05518864_103161 [Pantoea sp. YR525]
MATDNGITDAQWITWALNVTGWLVAGLVARFVLRKNARNSWIGDVKKALGELEDNAIEFWMGKNEDNEIIHLNKLKRKIKEITTLASEIQVYGGREYPLGEFAILRKAITTEFYHDEKDLKLIRELPANDNRIFQISSVCADLSIIYRRK